MDLLRSEVIVAIDPGKAFNGVWLTTGERGLVGEPVSLPVLRDGIEEPSRLIAQSGVEGPAGDRARGDWVVAPGVGVRARAALAGLAAAVRVSETTGTRGAARFAAL